MTTLLTELAIALSLLSASLSASPAVASTTPVVVIPPQNAYYVAKCEPYRHLLALYPWNVETALAVCGAESGGYAAAHGDTTLTPSSWGLFQIRALEGRPPPEELRNPVVSVREAHKLWLNAGGFKKDWTVCGKKVVC